MKNAMKKLLSLALVAMLLVSVVPMGAMADEWLPNNSDGESNAPAGVNLDEPSALNVEGPGEGGSQADDSKFKVDADSNTGSGTGFDAKASATNVNVEVEISLDGTVTYAKTLSYPTGTKVSKVLEERGPAFNAETHDVKYVKDGAVVDENGNVDDTNNDGLTKLKIEILRKQIWVGVSVQGVTGKTDKYYPAGSEITLNEQFLKDCNLELTPGNEIKDWDFGSEIVANNKKVTITKDVNIVCRQGKPVGSTEPTEGTTTPTEKPTTPVAEYIDVTVNVDGDTKVNNTPFKAKSASIDQLLKSLVGDNWASVYKFDYWSEEGQPYKYANVNSVVAAGKRITINLVGGTSKHNTNKVMLHVFLNGNTSAVYASYNITGDLAQDYKVTYNEVKSYLMNRYKAKTDAGLDLDGLYYVTGNWVGNYFQDNKSKTIDDLDWELEKGYVHINVMLNNATAKTSSNADTSNPKTGDDIYMTVTVMGLSAAALCAVYYISKKRAVR